MKSVAARGAPRSGMRRRILAAGAALLGLTAAACGSATSGSTGSAGSTPVAGGTAVWAEPPATVPTYIFPYLDSANLTNINLFDFQYLMYRPLYWFGNGQQPTVNTSLSLADLPVIKGKNVTINLKNYKWSNGTQVTAQDVMFWLNMERGVPTSYGAYTGFPANVSNLKVVSPTQLTMTMDKTYSSTWFLYNELSQIIPMPAAWDRTASGPSDCATVVKDCAAVYSYLDAQAKKVTSYVGSPIWSIVDGPWKLSAFNADGNITFVPNKSYSGPVKPKLAAFQEVPFTTDAAEYNVLQSPNSGTKIDFGYLPNQDAPAKPANATLGTNPLASRGYTMAPLYLWGINYSAINYNSTVSDHAAIFKQTYFRQALEYLMNQKAIISGPLRGYGDATVGPVPATPATSFLSPQGKKGDSFPYNPAKAKSLLAANGWTVVPGGSTTCTDPAKCGPGITKGSPLTFNFLYLTGTGWISSEMQQLQSNAAALGIKLNLVGKPFSDIISTAGGNCKVTKGTCAWDMANWGGGWSFSPDYQPTGEELFMCGAPSNSGGYCDSKNDAMINTTLTNSSPQAFYNWQDYLAPQVPVLYQPNAAYQLSEVANNLKGALPQSPTQSINPENWYFVK